MALKVLYQMECGYEGIDDAFHLFKSNFFCPVYLQAYLERLVFGVTRYREKIDQLLNQVSRRWKVSRMSWVDRNILRLAVYEMFFDQEGLVPPKVVINEAVEIAKRYGGKNSPNFINGILDSLLGIEVKISD